jgi:hypothetical protein
MLKTATFDWLSEKEKTYPLHLEWLANEVVHALQNHRRALGLAIMDHVHVGVVQDPIDRLTSAIYCFVDAIVERVRIVHFSPNPMPGIEPTSYTFGTDSPAYSKPLSFTFDIYMVKAT